MAIGKISGSMLYDNLERQGIPLRFEGNLLYLDVNNSRIGINTDAPVHNLEVVGDAQIANIEINGSSIRSTSGLLDLGSNSDITIGGGTADYVLTTDGNGTLRWSDIGSLSQATGATGMNVILGTPTDGSLQTYAAWDSWQSTNTVTDAIDDLNQIALNIAKGTYVGEADFTANVIAGPSPMTVSFTSTVTGSPTNYYWDFGDGTTSTSGSTVTHTYDDDAGGQFTVTLRAYNYNGTLAGDLSSGARGSVDQEVKPDYITLYTPDPIPSLSLISDTIDTDDVTGLVITNYSEYANSYEIDWGDGVTETLTVINGGIKLVDGAIAYDPTTKGAIWEDDGAGEDTRAHTYSNTNGDTKYDLVISATSDTAGPSPVTVDSDPYDIYVYSEHQPSFTADTVTVVNEAATLGGVVSFSNTTNTNPGATATFANNRYRWEWDDGNTSTINISNGVAGNPGANISHTFALSESDQANGVTRTFDVALEVINEHSNSPFVSTPTTITVEPDVRAFLTGSTDTESDRNGDTSVTGYIYTDYNGNDRAAFTFDTTSQHADTYNWDWGDGSSSGTIAEGASGTSSGGSISHTYTSTGTKTVTLAIAGTPDTIAQTDSKTLTVTIAANPTAPDNLSSKTLSMSTSSQGTSPRLVYGATNNSGGAIPSAGSTITRYTSGTVTSNTITDANTAVSGTLVARINNADDGSVTFDTASDKSGTYTSLVVADDRDAHLAISASTYPTGFYKVFDARISKSITALPVGYNSFQLTHDVAGNTNSVGFVHDDLTAAPTVDTSSALLVEKTAGTYRYISGIPYYNTGGVVTATGVTVDNWIGQTYYYGNPLSIADGSNLESTTGSLISTQTKAYSDIDGTTSFLTTGIPNADTGNGTPYALGDFDISINGTSRAVGYLNVSVTNVNGTSTQQQISTPINVYSSSISGINEESISVLSSLGGTYTDAGKRVIVDNTGGANDATPAFNSSTNYYTTQAFTGAATVAGTNEAVTRWGVIKNVTTDFTTYLPPGPDLATGRTGYQYFTFAFRRTTLANFDIAVNGKISGLWIAAPGTAIDSSSTLNGWLDSSLNYAGSGVPGAGTGGNGSNGCAVTSSDRIPTGTAINSSYTMTLGGENLSNATGNVCLVRIQLATSDYINSIGIGAAA